MQLFPPMEGKPLTNSKEILCHAIDEIGRVEGRQGTWLDRVCPVDKWGM